MKVFSIAFVAAVALAHPIGAKTVMFDFDEYEHLDDYVDVDTAPPCLTQNRITHCDENFGLYNHARPYKMLSDYDWSARTSYIAEDGYRFSPLHFEVLEAVNHLTRVRCADLPHTVPCTESNQFFRADWVVDYRDEFEPVLYDFLRLTGYRNGALVAQIQINPIGLNDVLFRQDFVDLDRLDVAVIGSVDLFGIDRQGYSYQPDGYGYTCAVQPSPFQEGYCNYFTYDNFAFEVYPEGQLPTVPVPATSLLMLGALSALPLSRRMSAHLPLPNQFQAV